jgi:hypothetical protein
MKKILLSFLLMSAVVHVFAFQYTWTGASATPTLWNVAGNWSSSNGGTTFPGTSDEAIFNAAASVDLGANIIVDKLTINATLTLTANRTLQIISNLNINNGVSGTPVKFVACTTRKVTLGDGTTTFTLQTDANNFISSSNTGLGAGTNGAALTVNVPNTVAGGNALNLYFDPNATFYSLVLVKGDVVLKNSTYATRLTLTDLNSQRLILGANVTLNIQAYGTSTLYSSGSTTCGSLDASATGCKVILSANTAACADFSNRTLFAPDKDVNHLEIARGTNYATLGQNITVKNLTLTSGLLVNSTNSNVTVANGGTIYRSAGTILIPPVYGTTATDKVHVTINGTCTAGNELLGTPGKLGTLTVNNGFTYTLFSPSIAPGFHISAFNGGLGYPSAVATVGFDAPPSGTAPTAVTTTSFGNVSALVLTNGTGVYATAPAITISAPATPTAWTASTTWVKNNVHSNGGNLYVCTTAGAGAASGGPSGNSGAALATDGIIDNAAKWTYIGTSTATATATAAMLPTSITVDALTTVGTGRVNYPNTTTPTTLNVTNSLTNAGTITLNSQTSAVTHLLNVGGNITNTGTFSTSLASDKVLDVTLNGTAAQGINSALTFNNLTINNAASTSPVTINENASISGSLTVNAGAKLTLADTKTLGVTGNFTINSNEVNGTGSFTDLNALSGLTVSGTTTAHQYLGTARNWYVSSPISNAVAPVGFNYYQRDEAGASWTTQPFVATNTFVAGKGYIAFPDATGSTLSFVSQPTPTNGKFNHGDVPVSLTRSGSSSTGFNLIGNPYPSHLTWSKAFVEDVTNSALIEPSIYYRTNAGTTNSGAGAAWSFITYNASTDESTPSLAVKGIIPPMQAFWVRAKASGELLLDSKLTRLHQNSNPLKAPALRSSSRSCVRLEVSNGIRKDETLLIFDENAADGFDAFDSRKFEESSSEVQLYTTVGTEKLVMNGMKTMPLNRELDLFFVPGSASTFSIKANEVRNLPSDVRIILKDNITNSETDLTNGYSSYEFSPLTTTSNRFSLLFRTADGITKVSATENINAHVYVNAANQIAIVAPLKAKFGIYNVMGQKQCEQIVEASTTTVDKALGSGVYFVTISLNGHREIQKVVIR